MRKLIKSSLSLALAALMSVSMLSHAGDAVAEEGSSGVSYNVGYMSEYWYRGVYQSESAVSFGADMEMGSMYIGTWWADVDEGVEYDIYAGFNFELMGLPMYLGATGYYYSDNFDGDYEELNTGVDLGFATIDYAFAAYPAGSDDPNAGNQVGEWVNAQFTSPDGRYVEWYHIADGKLYNWNQAKAEIAKSE